MPTPIEAISKTVSVVRENFNSGITRPVEWRIGQLKALRRMMVENEAAIVEALNKDLGQNEWWCRNIEVGGVIKECDVCLKNIKTWVKPESVSTILLSLPAKSYIQPEPFGVIMIISPWNYPISMPFVPLADAIAAGNAAILKPSEISVHTSKLVARLVRDYMDNDAITVIEGGIPETTELLKQRFDLSYFTGATSVGKIVMAAAAKHLSPCILELGGKCPAIIADDADLNNAAKRIVWAKWTMNIGQTCLSPDYILTTEANRDKVIAKLKETLKSFYGDKPRESSDIGRMINERHCERVVRLLDDKSIKIVEGGEYDIKDKYIAPTIVVATPESKVMEDEIFGPILPIITVKDTAAAIEFVNAREKPLALYVFSKSGDTGREVIKRTSSGGACINDCLLHAGSHYLPFGGVGHSGMGAYHGKHGFDAFSHKKSVLEKYGSDPSVRYPPYTRSKVVWTGRLARLDGEQIFKGLKIASTLVVMGVLIKFLGPSLLARL